MSNTNTGSCLCGEINFEIEGDFESFYLCHCKYCQKDTGSAHAANLFSKNAKIKWIKGEDKKRTFKLPSTQHTKSFCTLCGSALPNVRMNGELLVVPAGCLDKKIHIKPSAHIYMSSRATWDNNLDQITKIDKLQGSR